MKVYIIAQSDYECGGSYAGKIFDSEEKAKKFVDRKNKKIYKGWLEWAQTETGKLMEMRLKEAGSPEAYAKHMLEQEDYFYYIGEVE
jgi:hypothetical protein